MLRYLKYIFPACVFDSLAEAQTLIAGQSYSLDGLLAQGNKVSFITKGYARNIALSSGGPDYSGVTFTIIGTQNGVHITEALVGPGAGTKVFSTNVFDTVESVSVNGNVANCTIGTGPKGYFKLIQINRLGGLVQYSLSLESSVTPGEIPTVVYTTVENIENNGQTFQDIINSGIPNSVEPLYTVKASSSLTQYSIQYPYTSSLSIPNVAPPIPLLTNYYLIALNGDNTTLNSGMTLIFTQV